jgi:hypothetical protein
MISHDIQRLDAEQLYSEQDLARITGRSIASIRRDRMFRVGCPFVKIGKLVRYSPTDVREYLERCRRPTRAH